MTLPATDSFTDSNDVTLPTHNSAWVENVGHFDIQSNSLTMLSAPANYVLAHWSGDTFGNDQYSQVKCVAVDSTQFNYNGVAVRVHASANTGYGLIGDGNETILYKVVAGTRTQLGSSGPATHVNDILRIEVTGTSVRPMLNGSTISAIGVQTDSSISSGSAGVAGFLFDTFFRTLARADDWEGGNIGGGTDSLTASGIETGSPVLGSPSLSQVHSLTATGIASGSPILGNPSITGSYDLTAPGIATGSPIFGHPSLSQLHVLSASNLITGSPIFSHPELNPPEIITPVDRVLVINGEIRVLWIARENRILFIE